MKNARTFKTLGVALGCAGLVLFGIAAAQPPRSTIPVVGTGGTTFKLIPTTTPGVFDNPIQGVGNVSGLGPCTIIIQQTVDFRNDPPTLDSSLVLEFATGEKLNVRSQGTGTPDQINPAFIRLSDEAMITGGTGRFQNATGALRFPGVAHVETPSGVFPAEGHGTFFIEGFIQLSQ